MIVKSMMIKMEAYANLIQKSQKKFLILMIIRFPGIARF